MPPMMSDDEDSNCIAYRPEKKMVWKSFEIDTADVLRANRIGLWMLCSVLDKSPKFRVKILSQRAVGDLLIIFHDRLNVRNDAPMQDDLLHSR
jgi:hypothetical protein